MSVMGGRPTVIIRAVNMRENWVDGMLRHEIGELWSLILAVSCVFFTSANEVLNSGQFVCPSVVHSFRPLVSSQYYSSHYSEKI